MELEQSESGKKIGLVIDTLEEDYLIQKTCAREHAEDFIDHILMLKLTNDLRPYADVTIRPYPNPSFLLRPSERPKYDIKDILNFHDLSDAQIAEMAKEYPKPAVPLRIVELGRLGIKLDSRDDLDVGIGRSEASEGQLLAITRRNSADKILGVAGLKAA